MGTLCAKNNISEQNIKKKIIDINNENGNIINDDQTNPNDSSRMSISNATLEDFEKLKVLGKGSFGKVLLVRLKTNGNYYAMKILKKYAVMKRKQIDHTKTERLLLST